MNLIDKILDPKNLYKAYKETSKNNKRNIDYLRFDEFVFYNINKMIDDVRHNRYKIGDYIHFTVKDPKPRNITALQFKDRVLQRAMYNVLYPLLDKKFSSSSFACRKNKGTHKASNITHKFMRMGYRYYLKTDFSKYFMSIDRKILWTRIKKYIKCKETLNLIRLFVPIRGKGLNIGELLSQLFANLYGNIVDKFIENELNIKHYIRYMDDIILFSNSYDRCFDIKNKLEIKIKSIGLTFSKWFIKKVVDGINFVGYIHYMNKKFIRKSSIRRCFKKLRYYIKNNKVDEYVKFIISWFGYISHANNTNLITKLQLEGLLCTIITK